jgi:hypothetical protein
LKERCHHAVSAGYFFFFRGNLFDKKKDLRRGLGLGFGVVWASDSHLKMESPHRESEVSAAAPSNVESVPSSSNGNGHGFVPLVTVVGFHHARCAILDPESMGRQLIGSWIEDRKSRVGLGPRRGLILRLIMSGLFCRSWH